MNDYELALVLKPSLSETEVKSTIESLEKFIQTGHKGKVFTREDWGRRKLSYQIAKEDTGYYFFLRYSLDSKLAPELNKKLRLNSHILRYLITQI